MSFNKHLNQFGHFHELQEDQRARPLQTSCLGVGIMSHNICNEFFVFWMINSPLFSGKWIDQECYIPEFGPKL